MCFRGRFVSCWASQDGLWAVIGNTKDGSIGRGPRGVDFDWRMVDREDIGQTVIKPVMALEVEEHVKESVVTVKMERAESSIFVTGHHPRDKDVSGGKNCLGGDNCLHHICAKEGYLPVDRPVRDPQRKKPAFCATVVNRGVTFLERSRDGEGWDNNHTNQDV